MIASDIGFSGPVAEMIRQHHERIDGSGYPEGLTGDGILQASQIIAVSDVVSAMYSRRPSRPVLSLEAVLSDIETGCGRFYRTDIVDACLRLFRDRGFLPGPVGVTRT